MKIFIMSSGDFVSGKVFKALCEKEDLERQIKSIKTELKEIPKRLDKKEKELKEANKITSTLKEVK